VAITRAHGRAQITSRHERELSPLDPHRMVVRDERRKNLSLFRIRDGYVFVLLQVKYS
jgi:hypothetical protein